VKLNALALLLLSPFATHAAGCTCTDGTTPYTSLQNLPIGTSVKVAACYHSDRHGASLRSCDTPDEAGVRSDFDDSAWTTATVRALSEASGAQWLPNSRQVIRVHVSGRFERSDLEVPGGQRFLITQLHCFEVLPDDRTAPIPPDVPR